MTMGRYYTLRVMNQALTDGTTLNFPHAPLHFGEWADEVTWTIGVHAVTGSPTAWSVTAQPLLRLQHAGGPNTGGFQNRNGQWFPLDDASVQNCIVQGQGFSGTGTTALTAGHLGDFATVADKASHPELEKSTFYASQGTKVVVSRTFRNFGPDVGLTLKTAATGGAAPKLFVSVNVFAKG